MTINRTCIQPTSTSSFLGPTTTLVNHICQKYGAEPPFIKEVFHLMTNDRLFRENQDNLPSKEYLKEIVDRVCQSENEESEYYPLYHATTLSNYCWTQFTRAFITTKTNESEQLDQTIPFLRFPQIGGALTVEQYFEANPLPPISALPPFDWNEEVQKAFISLNPNLFGNTAASTGESTWFWFLVNKNMTDISHERYAKELCSHYKIKNGSEISLNWKLYTLHERLQKAACKYIESLYPRMKGPYPFEAHWEPKEDITRPNNGVLLQFLVPKEHVDKICYASIVCGYPSEGKPLSERLENLRQNPDEGSKLQVRMLVQNIFDQTLGIKVATYGYEDFFSDALPQRPATMSDESWCNLKEAFEEKRAILAEAKDLFLKVEFESSIPSS